MHKLMIEENREDKKTTKSRKMQQLIQVMIKLKKRLSICIKVYTFQKNGLIIHVEVWITKTMKTSSI